MSAVAYEINVVHADNVRAREFVDRRYEHAFGTKPPVAHLYVLACRAGEPVACIGIEYAGEDGLFPVEHIHNICRTKPAWYNGHNTVQYGRLAGVDTAATFAVIRASALYAQKLGRTYAIFEQERRVYLRYARAGLRYTELRGSGLNLRAVAPENREHYVRSGMKPYLVELSQVVAMAEAQAA